MKAILFHHCARNACFLAFIASVIWIPVAPGQTPQKADTSHETHLLHSWALSIPVGPAVLSQSTSEADIPVSVTCRKLEEIIVPEMKFDHTPVSEAVDFLRHESIRLDKDSPPETRGVKISVQWWFPSKAPQSSDESNANPPPVPEPTVTLNAANLSLWKALRYLAGKIYAGMKVTGKGVILRPFAITDPLFISEFRVNPERIGFSAIIVAEARNFLPITEECKGIPILDAKPFFRSKGFDFSEGSNAVYLPNVDRLIVRFDSEETMDKLAAFVDQMSTPLAPTLIPANP